MDSLEKEKTTISLKEMWDLFYFNRFRITLITATVSILSIIYALILTPVFKAESGKSGSTPATKCEPCASSIRTGNPFN